jgi:hypothetical protein
MASITTWLLHSIVIQLSIAAFAAPFWLWYRISRPASEKHSHLSLGEHIELFFSSSQMNWLVFCWAASEAVVWFIIPEFLLLLIIFMRIRQRTALLFWDLAGTMLGTIVAFAISAPAANVAHMPYLTIGMTAQVIDWYQRFGAAALLFQPLSGIPYKVFTLLASAHHIGLVTLILVGAAVRMGRYILFYIILTGLYPLFHRFVFRRYIGIFVVSCMVFSFFLLRIVNNYGPGYQLQDGNSIFVEIFQKR